MAMVSAVALGLAGGSALAADPDATVKFESKEGGWLVRVEWGDGLLTLADGSEHAFTIESVKLLGAGAAEVTATGEVYNLKSLEDFTGDYAIAEAGITVLKGGSKEILKNGAGVEMHLTTHEEGIELDIGAGGFEIALKK
jgi:hypothetical protein